MNNKRTIIIIILVFILFLLNINAIFYEYSYIDERSKQGNSRWQEVENRLLDMDNKITNLEKEIFNGRDG